MWCPTCRCEFVESVQECPECHVELVDALPDEEVDYVPDTWSRVALYQDEALGEFACGLLRSQGIPCRLQNLTFHAEPVPVSASLVRVYLWVPPDRVDEAREVLERAQDGDFAADAEAPDEPEDGAPR